MPVTVVEPKTTVTTALHFVSSGIIVVLVVVVVVDNNVVAVSPCRIKNVVIAPQIGITGLVDQMLFQILVFNAGTSGISRHKTRNNGNAIVRRQPFAVVVVVVTMPPYLCRVTWILVQQYCPNPSAATTTDTAVIVVVM